MAGLKPEQWQSWNSENLHKQEAISEQNVDSLLDNLSGFLKEQNCFMYYKVKFSNWKRSQLAFDQLVKTKDIFVLQRDLAALEFFISQGFGEKIGEIRFRDLNGIYLQIKTIMSETGTPTFPQMVRDAITAIETDGHQPPAEDMVVYHAIDAVKGDVVRIEQVDGGISHPEAIEFDKIVEILRDNIEESEVDEEDKYNANTEIDRIIARKLNYAEKITQFHQSEILQPFLPKK